MVTDYDKNESEWMFQTRAEKYIDNLEAAVQYGTVEKRPQYLAWAPRLTPLEYSRGHHYVSSQDASAS